MSVKVIVRDGSKFAESPLRRRNLKYAFSPGFLLVPQPKDRRAYRVGVYTKLLSQKYAELEYNILLTSYYDAESIAKIFGVSAISLSESVQEAEEVQYISVTELRGPKAGVGAFYRIYLAGTAVDTTGEIYIPVECVTLERLNGETSAMMEDGARIELATGLVQWARRSRAPPNTRVLSNTILENPDLEDINKNVFVIGTGVDYSVSYNQVDKRPEYVFFYFPPNLLQM